jgi:hypothetical protein
MTPRAQPRSLWERRALARSAPGSWPPVYPVGGYVAAVLISEIAVGAAVGLGADEESSATVAVGIGGLWPAFLGAVVLASRAAHGGRGSAGACSTLDVADDADDAPDR